MKTTHTPGPWTRSADGQRILGIETDEEQPVIAEVYGAACEDQEGAANARLLTAAPDLLAAIYQLERVARLINDDQHAGREVLPYQWSDLWDACNSARAVIAEATAQP
jgi:hypothetical protein